MFRIVGYDGPDIDIELPDMEIDNDICDRTWEKSCSHSTTMTQGKEDTNGTGNICRWV